MDTLSGLRLFIRVVETGNFSKASADLDITQPTATKVVAAIEQRLGARLLHRSTRGVMPTQVGARYYERCKSIALEIEAAYNLATLMQGVVAGTLRVSCSVAFGRRVLVPLAMQYMHGHPILIVDLIFEERYVNLVEQGVDLAIRMGRLADSTLGSRYLGRNPWLMVAAPTYLKACGTPKHPAELSQHACLVYSTVQGDDRWMLTGPDGKEQVVAVRAAAIEQPLGRARRCARGPGHRDLALVRGARIGGRRQREADPRTPRAADAGDSRSVPSPKLVPGKVSSFIDHLPRIYGVVRRVADRDLGRYADSPSLAKRGDPDVVINVLAQLKGLPPTFAK